MSVKLVGAVKKNGPKSIALRFVLMVLADYAEDNGESCFPSYNTLANDCVMSRDYAKKLVKQLASEGWVSIEPAYRKNGSQKSNNFHLNVSKLMGDEDAPVPQIGAHQDDNTPREGTMVTGGGDYSPPLDPSVKNIKNTEGLRSATPRPTPLGSPAEESPEELPALEDSSSLKEAGAERREEPEPSNVLTIRNGSDWWWPIWRSSVQVPEIKARLEELSLYPALELAAQDAPPSWLPDWALLKINDIGRDNGLDLANNSVFIAAYLQWMDGQRSQGRKISKSGVNTFFRRLARDAAGDMNNAIRWTALGSTWRTFKLEYVERPSNPGVNPAQAKNPLQEPQPHDDPRWIALRDAATAGRPLSPAQQAVFDELDARWKALQLNANVSTPLSVTYVLFRDQEDIAPAALKLLENYVAPPAPDDALGKVEEVQGTSVLISSDLGVDAGQDERYSRKGLIIQPQPQKRSQRVFRASEWISQNDGFYPKRSQGDLGASQGKSVSPCPVPGRENCNNSRPFCNETRPQNAPKAYSVFDIEFQSAMMQS